MSNVIRIVTIDLMRHGERAKGPDGKSLDEHTSFGLQQVSASVELNLEGIHPDAVYHSERERARQAAIRAAEVLGYGRSPVPHEAFFVDSFFEGQAGDDLDAADAIIGEHGTIEQLILYWPAGKAARRQVEKGLVGIAEELVMLDPDQDEYYVVVGYHGPLTGIAALDQSAMPANTDYADMVCYELTNDGSGWVIAASVHLKCPLVKLGS